MTKIAKQTAVKKRHKVPVGRSGYKTAGDHNEHPDKRQGHRD
tara:strand:+ start:233 stop:358 length:126 start_codon:yes stop_codon:yes gene_type:complete